MELTREQQLVANDVLRDALALIRTAGARAGEFEIVAENLADPMLTACQLATLITNFAWEIGAIERLAEQLEAWQQKALD